MKTIGRASRVDSFADMTAFAKCEMLYTKLKCWKCVASSLMGVKRSVNSKRDADYALTQEVTG